MGNYDYFVVTLSFSIFKKDLFTFIVWVCFTCMYVLNPVCTVPTGGRRGHHVGTWNRTLGKSSEYSELQSPLVSPEFADVLVR